MFESYSGARRLEQAVAVCIVYHRRSNYASFLILCQNSISQTDNNASHSGRGTNLRNAIITAAWQLARRAHSIAVQLNSEEGASHHCL